MEECAVSYAAYILELMETAEKTCAGPTVLFEHQLDFSKYVEGGFGTGDCKMADNPCGNYLQF